MLSDPRTEENGVDVLLHEQTDLAIQSPVHHPWIEKFDLTGGRKRRKTTKTSLVDLKPFCVFTYTKSAALQRGKSLSK